MTVSHSTLQTPAPDAGTRTGVVVAAPGAPARAETAPGPAWWRVLFRVFRFEEAIVLGLLLLFVVSYALIEGGPGFERLWAGFTYNFHGHGTMWMFVL